jgi:two-component system sensor histidine kinase YcbA
MKRNWLAVILMILIVPLAGELKFYPFVGEFSSFRVSLGSPAFLFFILWLRKPALPVIGFLAGLSVLLFRIVLDRFTLGTGLAASCLLHLPAFFYYIAYSLVFHFVKRLNFYNQPLLIALWSIIAEISASMVELTLILVRSSETVMFSLPIISKILITAIIRSFFVLSFFFIMKLRQAEFLAEQQKEQNKHMLLLISSLYKELIHLAKSQQNAENITKECYFLYKNLQNCEITLNKNQLAQDILGIAGQVHEIKKDNQRIYASLTQLISDGKLSDYLPPYELADIIVQTHQRYARALNKSIEFKVQVEAALPPLHVYTVLSLVNNLVSNSVESITESGLIKVSFYRSEDSIEFRVVDNGPGIPQNKKNLIFKPGYTTKFTISGTPSTGMGLCYIKELVGKLQGSIQLPDPLPAGETVFVIQLPLKSISGEG